MTPQSLLWCSGVLTALLSLSLVKTAWYRRLDALAFVLAGLLASGSVVILVLLGHTGVWLIYALFFSVFIFGITLDSAMRDADMQKHIDLTFANAEADAAHIARQPLDTMKDACNAIDQHRQITTAFRVLVRRLAKAQGYEIKGD